MDGWMDGRIYLLFNTGLNIALTAGNDNTLLTLHYCNSPLHFHSMVDSSLTGHLHSYFEHLIFSGWGSVNILKIFLFCLCHCFKGVWIESFLLWRILRDENVSTYWKLWSVTCSHVARSWVKKALIGRHRLSAFMKGLPICLQASSMLFRAGYGESRKFGVSFCQP